MTPQSKRYKPAYAKVLLSIAHGDLGSARALKDASRGRPENVVYLAQQAVEKVIKAVLCACGEPVPISHDVEALLIAIPDGVERPPDEVSLHALTEFATIRRYEEGFYELTNDELEGVLTSTQRVLEWGTRVCCQS